MQEAAPDWTKADPRPNWSVIIASGLGRKVALKWIGHAEDEAEAQATALRIAAIARKIAARIDGEPIGPIDDIVISCEDVDDARPCITINSEMTINTMIPERRALPRTRPLSGRAMAAMEAAFHWAAAYATVEYGHVASPQACRKAPHAGLADNIIGYAIHVETDFQAGNPRMSDALREAFSVFSIAYWMSGGPEPKGNAPEIGGHPSATATAALRTALVAKRCENVRLAIRFLDDLELYDVAEALAREHGDI